MEINNTSLERARSYLESKGRIPSGALPPDIAESWYKSQEMGLDPFAGVGDFVLDEMSFSDVKAKNSELIAFAKPELELLYDQIAGSDFIIALGSPDGVILDTLADTQFGYSDAAKVVIPSSVWTEELRGTNALGTVARTKKPIQVYGGEHYLRVHSEVSCIGAPIFDGKGNLAGLLDASCRTNIRQQHTAALVQMSAGNIENNLIRNSNYKNLIVQFHPRPEYLNTLSAGLIVLDEDYKIIAANRRGQSYIYNKKSILGSHFEHLFECQFNEIIKQLSLGEVLRLRDKFGSAYSVRCVANKASFAAAKTLHATFKNTYVSEKRVVEKNHFRDLLIEDAKLRKSLQIVYENLKNISAIFIHGSEGTGKTITARMIHAASERTGEFVVIDCSLLSHSNLEAVFYDNDNHKTKGAFSRAKSGTLYLDNVHKLPLLMQTVIKRLITNHEVLDINTQSKTTADILVLSSSFSSKINENFDISFDHVLKGSIIELPDLKNRSDLTRIIKNILTYKNSNLEFEDDAAKVIKSYDWPGNFFELRRFIDDVLTLDKKLISLKDLKKLDYTFAELKDDLKPCCACSGTSWKEELCRTIQTVVLDNNGNVSSAARELGMSRTTIYKHLDLTN